MKARDMGTISAIHKDSPFNTLLVACRQMNTHISNACAQLMESTTQPTLQQQLATCTKATIQMAEALQKLESAYKAHTTQTRHSRTHTGALTYKKTTLQHQESLLQLTVCLEAIADPFLAALPNHNIIDPTHTELRNQIIEETKVAMSTFAKEAVPAIQSMKQAATRKI